MIRVKLLKLLLFVCIIVKVHSLAPYHFRCSNGKYIHDLWFCDGSVECNGDESDENYGCDPSTCGNGKFKCTDGSCKDISLICNNINDCSDGSDEKNCGDEIDIDDCPSREGSFTCKDESKCIDLANMCDGYCNCLDCSDENAGCLQYDNYICDKCSDTCLTTNDTNDLSKVLSKNYKFTPCVACDFAITCQQKCVSIKFSEERCLCDENYEKNDFNEYGRQTCRNKVPYENVIIYSTPNSVKLFNFTTNETILILNATDCTVLSGVRNSIYFARSIDDRSRIYKTWINSNEALFILESDSIILSLAVDWITNNIYYTTESSITVCSSDGRTCTKLRSCSKCRVKLSPKLGLMFWSENGTLFQSHMDGTNEQNFTTTRYYNQYSSLYDRSRFLFTVDESTDIVYWSGNLPVLRKSRLYSGGFHETIFIPYSIRKGLFFDLDEFENSIYFTTENNNSIYCYNSSRDVLLSYSFALVTDEESIQYIHVYNPLLQRTGIPNPCAEAKCSLCLLKPFTPFIGLNYVCKCENVSSTDDQFSCEDESREKSKIVPDATARKRDIYDVKNPPFTWGDFFRKIKSIIIIVLLILMSVVMYLGFNLWKKFKKYGTADITTELR